MRLEAFAGTEGPQLETKSGITGLIYYYLVVHHDVSTELQPEISTEPSFPNHLCPPSDSLKAKRKFFEGEINYQKQ